MKFEYPELNEWFSIFPYVYRRGRVGYDMGIQFVIHPREAGHNKAHLHARYQNQEIVLEIPSGEVIAGDLGGKTHAAQEWVRSHEDFLKRKWDEFVDGVVTFG